MSTFDTLNELPDAVAEGLQAGTLAPYLGARRQGGDGVDHHNVHGARAHEGVDDLERLLTRVGLADEQLIDVDPDGPGVDRIHRVLGIDVSADAADSTPYRP